MDREDLLRSNVLSSPYERPATLSSRVEDKPQSYKMSSAAPVLKDASPALSRAAKAHIKRMERGHAVGSTSTVTKASDMGNLNSAVGGALAAAKNSSKHTKGGEGQLHGFPSGIAEEVKKMSTLAGNGDTFRDDRSVQEHIPDRDSHPAKAQVSNSSGLC